LLCRIRRCLTLLSSQALLEHLGQLGVDFFGFVWDDDVLVTAAAHALTPALDCPRPSSLLPSMDGSTCHTSPSQPVPWSPLTLELPLQFGSTYLCAAFSPRA
jgi:hypothetical protein